MSLVDLELVADPVARRESRDRVEVLTALLSAPNVEAFYRDDVIKVEPQHPVYAWECMAVACDAPRTGSKILCDAHLRRWNALSVTRPGISRYEFARTAAPVRRQALHDQPAPCQICLTRPSENHLRRLCDRHAESWKTATGTIEFEHWLARQEPKPGYGTCRVTVCPTLARGPLGLCRSHQRRYEAEGSPGGARLPQGWFNTHEQKGLTVPVECQDEAAFRDWCASVRPATRPGQVNLLGLPPLIQAEIRWGMVAHTRRKNHSHWPLRWIQDVADLAREQNIGSLYDEDLAVQTHGAHMVVRELRLELQLVYFAPADTREAGFLHTEHFGVRFPHRESAYDLTRVSQRWLRDLLWDTLAEMLQSARPPRSGAPFDGRRRACMELSAFLESACADGGHDPRRLTRDHMLRFVADQRRRAKDGLPSLALTVGTGKPSVVSQYTRSITFNNGRAVLRRALESGEAERIGLAREFITALPFGGNTDTGNRRPFSDKVARALADDANLAMLAERFDPNDRGVRDAWETLVATGRRCGEVLELRLECIGRYGNLPMLWHDQTKVGNYDEAIRIPEQVYQHLRARQRTTLARFEDRHGRPATAEERQGLALFPSNARNPHGDKSFSYSHFQRNFHDWVDQLDLGRQVMHQARHTLATNLLRHGAGLHHIKKYLGQVSMKMAEHYAKVASSEIEEILQHVWVAGPSAMEPGKLLSAPVDALDPAAVAAMAIDLSRRSTPAEGGFCTFQPVVNGAACPWNLNCEGCDKFVISGADLLYWRRKREQWRSIAERAPDDATADFLHQVFEPTARAIDGLEKSLAGLGLLDQALALDYRRPQDYFHRLWSTAFRASELAAVGYDSTNGTPSLTPEVET